MLLIPLRPWTLFPWCVVASASTANILKTRKARIVPFVGISRLPFFMSGAFRLIGSALTEKGKTMRLIDAESLNAKSGWVVRGFPNDGFNLYDHVEYVDLEDIKQAPIVDAVPVVSSDRKKLCPINYGLRCKDIDNCAFWCEWGQCAVKAIAVACADGERKDDAAD